MALPPEPLSELLPASSAVIHAEVAEVLSAAPTIERAPSAPAATSVPSQIGPQVVRLRVRRVLRGGALGDEIVVEKPPSAYALKAGNHGAFFLDTTGERPRIIGRYGPDTHSLQSVEHACARRAGPG